MALLQKISKTALSRQEMFEKYFLILLSVNSIHLPPAEIKLLGFIAANGSLISKQQFCEENKIPKTSLGNLIHQLSKKGWIVKKDKEIIINPIIKISTEEEIILNIKLNVERNTDREDS